MNAGSAVLSGEPDVDTGPNPASLLFAVVYVDPDFHSHLPSTGQAEPLISIPTRPAQGWLTLGAARVILTVHGQDTRVHPHPPRLPSSCLLSPRPHGRAGP